MCAARALKPDELPQTSLRRRLSLDDALEDAAPETYAYFLTLEELGA